jgi:pyruvate/2-oxoglutarate dehydrogenase complex dihydrolipoamide dehydrogenase (E3) component
LAAKDIYTIPEVGMVGQTEDALRQTGVEYCVGRAYYDGNARGKIIGDKTECSSFCFGHPICNY